MRFLKFVFLLFLGSYLSACASVGGEKVSSSSGYKIEQISKNNSAYGNLNVSYKSYDELVTIAEKKIANKMGTKEELAKEVAKIPPGGFFVVTINRSTIGAANPKWFTFVVKSDGKEIFRKTGANGVANTPVGVNMPWWSVEIVPIPNASFNNVTLYVADRLSSGRDEYKLTRR
jgi:hypothetical protein